MKKKIISIHKNSGNSAKEDFIKKLDDKKISPEEFDQFFINHQIWPDKATGIHDVFKLLWR